MKDEGESKKLKCLLAGGLGAAFLGSLCCIGPAVFIALGLGSFTAGAFFESLRPWMGAIAFIALALAWRQTLRNKACSNGKCEGPLKRNNGQILLLSIGTLLAVGVLAYPYASKAILEARNADSPAETESSGLLAVSIPSMDCASCAVGIQSKLAELEGIQSARITYETKLAEITYDPKRITENGILQAIEATGFPPKHLQPSQSHVQ